MTVASAASLKAYYAECDANNEAAAAYAASETAYDAYYDAFWKANADADADAACVALDAISAN